MIKVAFPTDEHRPFHDPRAVNVAQQITRDFDPDILVRGSDAIDFWKASFYQKDEDYWANTLQDEIDSWKDGEREWANVVREDCRKPFLVGNHEDRMRRYILRNAPAFSSLDALRLPSLLGFDDFGIRMAHNNELIVDGVLRIHHGERVNKHSAYTAKNVLENDPHINHAFGHTHRMGQHWKTSRGQRYFAVECGGLFDMKPDYISNPNWQQGFALFTVDKPIVNVELIQMFGRKDKIVAHWRDKEYVSE